MLFIGETEGDAELERQLLAGHARPPGRRHHPRLDVHADGRRCRGRSTAGPAVLLNALPSDRRPLPSVLPDEIEAGRAAARVLLEAGHRDGIHLIGAGPGAHDVPAGRVAAVERLEGIRTTLADAGVKVSSGRLLHRWQPQDGLAATSDLLQRTRRAR